MPFRQGRSPVEKPDLASRTRRAGCPQSAAWGWPFFGLLFFGHAKKSDSDPGRGSKARRRRPNRPTTTYKQKPKLTTNPRRRHIKAKPHQKQPSPRSPNTYSKLNTNLRRQHRQPRRQRRVTIPVKQTKPRKIKRRRHQASTQRMPAQRPRSLPGIRRHHAHRLSIVDTARTQPMPPQLIGIRVINQQLQRFAFDEMPSLFGVHAMPGTELTGSEQEMDGAQRRARRAGWLWCGVDAPVVAAFRMRLQRQVIDQHLRWRRRAHPVNLRRPHHSASPANAPPVHPARKAGTWVWPT